MRSLAKEDPSKDTLRLISGTSSKVTHQIFTDISVRTLQQCNCRVNAQRTGHHLQGNCIHETFPSDSDVKNNKETV